MAFKWKIFKISRLLWGIKFFIFFGNFFFYFLPVIIHALFYQLMGNAPEDNSYSIILYHIAVRSAVFKIFVHAMKLKNEVIIFWHIFMLISLYSMYIFDFLTTYIHSHLHDSIILLKFYMLFTLKINMIFWYFYINIYFNILLGIGQNKSYIKFW